jgi:hypothetical protein
MNRRLFIQALTAAGIAATVPLKIISASVAQHQFTRLPVHFFDFGHQIGISVAMNINGGMDKGGEYLRRAYLMRTEYWEAMTEPEREEVWLRLEGDVLDTAKRRGQIA